MGSSAVVILNWNGEEHLRQFLPSVVAHTPQWVDVVVADNGSSDGSVALLKSQFSGVKIIEMPQNLGFAGGYNQALSELDYQMVILLNSDVQVVAGWCEPLLTELSENPDVGAVGPKLRSYADPNSFEYAGASGGYIDFLGYPFCRGRILQHIEIDHNQYDDKRDLFWVSGAAFCCRLSVFKSLGGFDEDFFAHQEEIDLCWRMQLMGYRVRIVPQSVVYHLGGGTLNSSSPRKTMLNHRNNLAMLFKCAPTWQRILVAIVRPILDMMAALSYLLKGRGAEFRAVLEAYRDFMAWHSSLSAKRKAIRDARVSESKYIYRGSIVLRALFGRKHFDDMM